MGVDFDLEGVEDFGSDWDREVDKLSLNLRDCTMDAAADAVRAMQANHPYTDRTTKLTEGMHVVQGRVTRFTALAYINFRASYSNIVETGSSHAKPYPFTPIGYKVADKKLELCVEDALAMFCKGMGR